MSIVTVPLRKPMTVVLVADSTFALPLATTVRSLLDHRTSLHAVDLFVLDAGLSSDQRTRLTASWSDAVNVRVQFESVPLNRIAHLPTMHHLQAPTYARLLIPDVLPGSREKVLYLDADVLVLSDLQDLWDTDLGSAPLAAARDVIAPTVSSVHGLSLYQALGLAPDAPHFNAGVLLMNLPVWREERLGSRIIDYLARERSSVRHADQDGINAVLAGRILELEAHWNVGALETFYGSWEASPFCRELYEDLIAHPKILHFNTPDKPWNSACRHPQKDLFFHYVDRTVWSGWRPEMAQTVARTR